MNFTPGMEALAEELAAVVFAKLDPRIRALFAEMAVAAPDPLLKIGPASKRAGLSPSTLRHLRKIGELHCAPGLIDFHIRQSELDAYGSRVKKVG